MERRELLRAVASAAALTALSPGKTLAAWSRVASGIPLANGLSPAHTALVRAIADTIIPLLELIGKTVLATPQVAGQDRVGELWLIALGVADALLILFVLAGAALVMTHETLHTRYALKEMLPRIALAAILVNASLAVSGQMISAANALSGG